MSRVSTSFGSLFGQRQNISMKSLLDLTPLGERERNHLSRVYALLAVGVVSTGLGVYVSLYHFAFPLFLAVLGKMACVWYIVSTTGGYYANKESETKRLGAFLGLSYLMGVTITNLIAYANYISPTILPTAFFGTLAVFACFSGAALFAKERSMLFLGSMLSSMLMYLCLISLGNIFFRSRFANDIVTFGGLFVYIGFVLYDTQLTVEECKRGNNDYVMHALQFYIDAVAIFVRLVKILSEKEKKKEEKRRR